MSIKARRWFTTLSTVRTKAQVSKAGVTSGVSVSDLDVWSEDEGIYRGGCYLGKLNYKKLIVQVVAKLLLPANMINDHLRL